MNITQKHIDEIKPYWRNPRKNEKAVEAVKESIKQYGYNSPIVVDTKNVIIAGHTRYKALRQLGYETFNVVILDIPEDKAKQYRIADNKAAEKAEWDSDLLTYELREIEELGDMVKFFKAGELDKFFDIEDIVMDTPTFAETEAVIRATVIETTQPEKATEDTAAYEKRVQEEVEQRMREEAKRQAIAEQQRMKERQEELERQQEEYNKQEAELKNEFVDRGANREQDLIGVTCPHCLEKYMLSKSELLRKDKYESS